MVTEDQQSWCASLQCQMKEERLQPPPAVSSLQGADVMDGTTRISTWV